MNSPIKEVVFHPRTELLSGYYEVKDFVRENAGMSAIGGHLIGFMVGFAAASFDDKGWIGGAWLVSAVLVVVGMSYFVMKDYQKRFRHPHEPGHGNPFDLPNDDDDGLE